MRNIERDAGSMRSARTKMSSRITLIVVMLVALMVGPGGATPTVAGPANQSAGQTAPPPPPPPRPANQSPKLTSALDNLAETATSQGTGAALNVAASNGIIIASSLVRVEIEAVNPTRAGVKQAVSAAGGK